MKRQGKARKRTPAETRRLFDEAHEKFWLNESTGELIYRIPCGARSVGDRAGFDRNFVSGTSGSTNRYRYVSLDGRQELAHRVIWLMKHGNFPPRGIYIDHINGDGLDNRPANLRLVTPTENRANAKLSKRNKSGFRGVSQRGSRWIAQIGINGRKKYLGTYTTPMDAAQAYNRAAMRIWGDDVYAVRL